MPSHASSNPVASSTAAASVPPPDPLLIPTSTNAPLDGSGSSTADAATSTSPIRVVTSISNSISFVTITPSALSDLSSMLGSSNPTLQQSSTSFPQQAEPPASPSDTNSTASPVVASKAANHTRTIALASVLPSVVAIAILVLWLLRRRRIGIWKTKNAPPSEEELHSEDTRPVLGGSSTPQPLMASTASKERNLYGTINVSAASSNELLPHEEPMQSIMGISGSDTGTPSEPGAQWQNRPRTPGGISDSPPAYHTLTSSKLRFKKSAAQGRQLLGMGRVQVAEQAQNKADTADVVVVAKTPARRAGKN
ncbi:hypothetical protein EIP86_001888 [Pleurotus ostreatoroseus]|nr:hypothetical protein EIP86_001888 [Pleurotus ostreatoroseus]